MSKTLIACSTFMKSDALEVLLTSLREHGYFEGNKVIVTCDNGGKPYTITRKDNPNHPLFADNDLDSIEMPSAGQVAEKFEGVEVIHGKGRGGVAVNKNRAIKYFLDHKEYDYLLMLDDDIVFHAPGFIDLCIKSGHKHLTGYLGDPGDTSILFGELRSPFFETFPPQGEDDYVWYCKGSQGMMLWTDRPTIEAVGYFDPMAKGGFYGFEHSIWSNRINRLVVTKFQDWFPVLIGCHLYFHSQSVPNNYIADYSQNEKYWNKRKEEIFAGVDLKREKWVDN